VDRRDFEAQCRLARVWRRLGKADAAIESYRRALICDPGSPAAALELGDVLREQGRLRETITSLKAALEHNPNAAELHRALVDALVAHDGLDAAYTFYGLVRCDAGQIEIQAGDILCCAVVRNEAPRLPYFLSYYRRRGVARFLIVDNGSTDGTLPYLLAQPDVYTWRSSCSFNRANFGAAWFEVLLRQYGVAHWCLIVDADELLVYAEYEQRSLPDLCRDLDRKGKRALSAVLVDMYAETSVAGTHYTPGEDFLALCPYFDRRFFHTRHQQWGPYQNQVGYFGGMRQRVFGEQGSYYLSKVPLIKYGPDCILAGGQHWTNRPRAEIANETGCLLHFKYFSTFPAYVRQEVARKEHYAHAVQYDQYARALDGDQPLILYDPAHSVRFLNSRQLLELGIIQRDADTMPPARAVAHVEFPAVAPLEPGTPRPFWSVMITAYTRVDYVARALRSVLDQAPEPHCMQIEVVNDAADLDTAAALEAIVREVGGGRVTFYRHPEHCGHPGIFNLCVRRARGHWVHILHDDDWVAPDFYAALGTGIARAPEVGAAFCRQIRTDAAGGQQWISWLERESPGLLEGWLDRIAVMCRVQFSAMVVKRLAYEAVSGFCPQAASAFDWDMWKRLALRFPVWYEPRALAYFFQGGASETHHLARSGTQIAHARQAIAIARTYLPSDRVDDLSREAMQQYAVYARALAEQHWRRGDREAAIATIQEGLACDPTDALERDLLRLLRAAEDLPSMAARHYLAPPLGGAPMSGWPG
jgi:glycosyltransferase involved in cell wall biosynthesis